MEHRKQPPPPNEVDTGVERRFAQAGLEIRNAEGSQTATLRGYALRFGSTYDMGWFTEEVAPSALQNANLSDVRVLLNHDPNNILGRTSANTARVGVDNVGMWYEVDLPESPNGQNARVAVQRGDITQSSWGFTLRRDDTGRRTGDKWEMRNGKEHRILTDVDVVFDASPVVYPANPDTTIAKRSRDMAFETEERMGEAGVEVSITVNVAGGAVNTSENETTTEMGNDAPDPIAETKTNTFNPETLAMELELAEADFRAKKLIYEYEKICG